MSRFGRRNYTDLERIFYRARREAAAGQVIVCEYADGNRELVMRFVTRDGVQMVETMAGWTKDFTNLMTFQRITDAMAALHEKNPTRSQ